MEPVLREINVTYPESHRLLMEVLEFEPKSNCHQKPTSPPNAAASLYDTEVSWAAGLIQSCLRVVHDDMLFFFPLLFNPKGLFSNLMPLKFRHIGFLIVNIWWVWSLVYSNTFGSLQRQYLLEWKKVSAGEVFPTWFPRYQDLLVNEAGTLSQNDWQGLLRAESSTDSWVRCCCGFEGRKSGLQWHQNNFIMLFITSSVFHTTEHLLRDGHVNTTVNQAVYFHVV